MLLRNSEHAAWIPISCMIDGQTGSQVEELDKARIRPSLALLILFFINRVETKDIFFFKTPNWLYLLCFVQMYKQIIFDWLDFYGSWSFFFFHWHSVPPPPLSPRPVVIPTQVSPLGRSWGHGGWDPVTSPIKPYTISRLDSSFYHQGGEVGKRNSL